MMRFRITLTYEYAVKPENYGEGLTPQDMLDIDIAAYKDDPAWLIEAENLSWSGEIA